MNESISHHSSRELMVPSILAGYQCFNKVNNYQFLCLSFCQCISVSKIVDLNVLDVVSILRVDFARNSFRGAGRSFHWESGLLSPLVLAFNESR